MDEVDFNKIFTLTDVGDFTIVYESSTLYRTTHISPGYHCVDGICLF